ncbi:MAG TPA: Asp-tRNA(Asn)/Glu-tRNA(Gln) amidotransferase subunit GatC [Bacillota bacterium]|nr:Asp-tRNA(Asn)/Glu-tRNA(Gln) amidotransferase subunit GatC [Bacillota bacterium]
MAKITKEDVKQLANVSQIAMTDEEAENYVTEMQSIVDFATMLQELNTDDVEPTIHILQETNVLRPDEPKRLLTQEEALKNAPEAKDGYFKVPAILD